VILILGLGLITKLGLGLGFQFSLISMTDRIVLQAIDALYSPIINKQAQSEANKFLDNWQHSVDAWNDCLELLLKNFGELSIHAKLFLVQTLRKKITKELTQLPKQRHSKLRDEILSLIHQCNSSNVAALHGCTTQLCLCLAQLSLHMDESAWPSPISDICSLMTGIPAALKDFLILFSEEAQNAESGVASERSRKLLTENLENVFNFMKQDLVVYYKGLNVQKSNSSILQDYPSLAPLERVLLCFQRWMQILENNHHELVMQYAPMLIKVVMATFNPNYHSSYIGMDDGDLCATCDVASEFICELIYKAYRFGWEDLISMLFLHISDGITHMLQSHLQLAQGLENSTLEDSSISSEDMAVVARYLGFIIIDLLDGSLYKILAHNQLPPGSQELLQAILLLVEYPDLKVVESTFKIIESISDLVRDSSVQSKKSTSYTTLISTWLPNYVSFLIERMKCPAEGTLTGQKRDDFRDFRHVIGDVLKDCADMLGISQLLCFLATKIQALVVSKQGNTIDASQLFLNAASLEGYFSTLRMISSCVPDSEKSESSLQYIMHILPTIYLGLSSTNDNNPESRDAMYSCMLLINSYASWISNQSTDTPWVLQHLDTLKHVLTTQNRRERVFSGAVMAVRNLCRYGSAFMASHFGDWLFQFYQSEQQSTRSSLHDMDLLFQSIVFLVASMPPENAKSMYDPLAVDLLGKSKASLAAMVSADSTLESFQHHGSLCIDLLHRYALFLETSLSYKDNSASTSTESPLNFHPLLDSFLQTAMPLIDYLYQGNLYHIYSISDDACRKQIITPIIEEICRIERFAFQLFQVQLVSHIDSICQLFIKSLSVSMSINQLGYTEIIYTIRAFIKVYAHLTASDVNQSYTRTFDILLGHVHTNTISCLDSGNMSIRKEDDLLEVYFSLLTTILEYIPELLLGKQDLCIALLQYTERRYLLRDNHDPVVLSLILVFWNDMYHVLLDDTQDKVSQERLGFLIQYIPNFVSILLRGASTGTFPPGVWTELSQWMRTMGKVSSDGFLSAVHTHIANLDSNKMTIEEKDNWMKEITESLRSGKSLTRSLRQLARCSRQRGAVDAL
jgi:hypothetical protein